LSKSVVPDVVRDVGREDIIASEKVCDLRELQSQSFKLVDVNTQSICHDQSFLGELE